MDGCDNKQKNDQPAVLNVPPLPPDVQTNDLLLAKENQGISQEITQDELSNSEYLDKFFCLDKENKQLKCDVENLKKNIARLEADTSAELHQIQLEALEKIVNQQKLEIQQLSNNARQQKEITSREYQQLQGDNELKINNLSKKLEQVTKERDAMVMKYAVSENSAISLQRIIKELELKCKDQVKEKDVLQAKIVANVAEKAKLTSIIDDKDAEIVGVRRELQKKKDELHLQSSSLKFFQNKLKLETEKGEEARIEIEKLKQRINEAKEETEQVRKDGQEIIRRYETDGRKLLEMKDLAEITSLQEQVEHWRIKHNEITEENNNLCKRVQLLESERLEYEQNLSKYRKNHADYEKSLIDLQTVSSELESSQLLMTREQNRVSLIQAEVDRLKLTNSELQDEIQKCRERETELLSFTQMLTEKNVALQSEFSGLELRLQQHEADLITASRQVENLTAENSMIRQELNDERRQRSEEKEMLVRHLDEKSSTAARVLQQLEDQIDENRLMKKKHFASIKELSRELQSLRRKADTFDSTSLSLGSHTSSNTSLNNIDATEARIALPVTPPLPNEPDRQLLIEKIVKIQRSNARKQEKIEFLEEHSRQLIIELQKKSKIIQNIVMKQQPGALVSQEMDNNKTALSKHGGIMASVYTSKPVDESITLELSLEINRKLQAVLEDTLLKNITLKDNMETLGNEIARLASRQS